MIKRLQDDGNMGLIQGWTNGLEHVYRAADCVLTAHDIDVRTVREAMACGCPVVRIRDIINSGIAQGLKEDRHQVRVNAEQSFDPAVSALQFKDVLCSF